MELVGVVSREDCNHGKITVNGTNRPELIHYSFLSSARSNEERARWRASPNSYKATPLDHSLPALFFYQQVL